MSSLASLVRHLRAYLHLESDVHVVFATAVAVSARFSGDPLWGLIVGAPSGGKTEVIRVYDRIADDHITDITGPGLLSWSGGKRPRAVGLLARIPSDGAFATIADLSTLLSTSDRGGRDDLYALLRRAYDGEVVRDLGAQPEPLRWKGRLTLLAGVTPSIDNYASHADALGPRWLYVRLPPSSLETAKALARKARESAPAIEAHRAEAREIAAEVVRNARDRAERILVPGALADKLDEIALTLCFGRATVPRESSGRRDIRGGAVVEETPRVAVQLHQLTRSALALGLDKSQALALARRSGLDSMPLLRRKVLEALSAREPLIASEIGRRAGFDRKTAQRTLEELEFIGVCESTRGRQGRTEWFLTGEIGDVVARVFAADLEADGSKCGELTTTTPSDEDGKTQFDPPPAPPPTPDPPVEQGAEAQVDRTTRAVDALLEAGEIAVDRAIAEVAPDVDLPQRRERERFVRGILREQKARGRYRIFTDQGVRKIVRQPELPNIFRDGDAAS